MIIRLPIDIKSLYLNIKNDNQSGHTPTVATPLRQGKSVHLELAQILNVPHNIHNDSKEELSVKLLSNSRAEAIITDVYVFDRIMVNGVDVDVDSSYCIYIREEINPENVHCGRQKVHYPQALSYEDENVQINNRAVIRAISETLHNYAFVVVAFEYDTESKKLNFDALIVGDNGVPYSKVFINKRGVGEKFSLVFSEYSDVYDSEIIALRKQLGYDSVNPDNYVEVMSENRNRALKIVKDSLECSDDFELREISSQYPYSMYDFELVNSLKKKYVVVRFTSTKIHYFSLSSKCISFLNHFPTQTEVYLVSDINGNPSISKYNYESIKDMKKSIGSVTYEERGGTNGITS